MTISVAAFVKAAQDSGVLTADSLAAYLQVAGPDADASALARRLVEDDRLTAFQAACLSRGDAAPLVLGPYVILDLLGRGGMGSVYKAEHRPMRRIVALKVITPKALTGSTAVRRFEREAQAAARLEHPNIVTAFDAGEAAGVHYIVMQFIDGRNLFDVVRDSGPQPVDRAVDWILQAARGLAYAHGKGVIHRDIKPGNLLVDQDGTVKILDMGIARLACLDADQDQLTGTSEIVGTIDYMAPEQAIDTRQADARSDIYSLGVTLWYVLVGQPLFSGTTSMSKVLAHLQAPVPALDSVRGDVHPEVSVAFQRMVAKKPADRFQSMDEVIAALQPPPRRAIGPGNGGKDAGATSLQPPAGRRFPALPAALVGGVFLAMILAGLVMRTAGGRREALPSGRPPRAGDGLVSRTRSGISLPLAVAPFDSIQARQHQREWAKHLGIEVETVNSIGARFVVIPPGRFTMGEGDNTVEVTLTKPFLLGQTEVTQGQWHEVMGTRPWEGESCTLEKADVAATFISWEDAVVFCEKLTERERERGIIGREQEYRLPTEAEWEFACRAGTVTRFSFGSDQGLLGNHAWFGGGWPDPPLPGGNTATELYAHPVGQKRPNAWGLFDMHGNVWEWCSNRYGGERHGGAEADASPTPEGPSEPSLRVHRGGGWNHPAAYCRSAIRYGHAPSSRIFNLGFRLALSPPTAAPPATASPVAAPAHSRLDQRGLQPDLEGGREPHPACPAWIAGTR